MARDGRNARAVPDYWDVAMLHVSEQSVGGRISDRVSSDVECFAASPVVRRFSGSCDMGGNQTTKQLDDLDLVAEVDQRIGVAAMMTRFHNSRIGDAIRYHLAAGGNRTRARAV